MTDDDLVALGWYPNAHKARRVLHKLERRGKVKRVGFVRINGRLKTLWAAFPIAIRKTEHEHDLWLLLKGARVHEVLTGSHVSPEWESDAELRVGKDLAYLLERDRNTERQLQVTGRFRTLRHAPVDVLWVVDSDRRRDLFLGMARRMGIDHFLVAIFDDAVRDFHGPVWKQTDGRFVGIDGIPRHEAWLASLCQPER